MVPGVESYGRGLQYVTARGWRSEPDTINRTRTLMTGGTASGPRAITQIPIS